MPQCTNQKCNAHIQGRLSIDGYCPVCGRPLFPADYYDRHGDVSRDDRGVLKPAGVLQ